MTIRRRVVVLVAAALCVSFATLLLFSTWPNAAALEPRATNDGGDQPLFSSMTFSDGDSNTSAAYRNNDTTVTWRTKIRRQRRQLQLTSSFNCPEIKSPEPQLPSIPLLKQSFYAASFPSYDDKIITKSLVESMTGLLVGDASTSPSLRKMEALGESNVFGQGEVIALRTHFPHTSGKLASWDEDIPKAFVLLRNPMHAIPQYFNQVYRINNHLGPDSRAPFTNEHAQSSHDAWIKWREKQLHSQILLYRRFVSFWMEKFLGNDANRIYLSYEELMEQDDVPDEAIRLATFLHDGIQSNTVEMMDMFGGSIDDHSIAETTTKAMVRMVRLEDVPCLWKSVVHHHRGVGDEYNYNWVWSQEERPYLPEDLMAISTMLLELINRWSRHQRLLNILSKYHREVYKVYLEATASKSDDDDVVIEKGKQEVSEVQSIDLETIVDIQALPEVKPSTTTMNKSFHIFQASPPSTGAIFLTNWLVGVFEPNADIAYMEVPEQPVIQNGHAINIASSIVTKTNYLDLLHLYKKYRPLFDEVLFVVSISSVIDSVGPDLHDLCEYKNVLCIDSEELVYNNRDELIGVIRNLTNKFRNRFRYFFGQGSEWLSFDKEENSLLRLEAMSKAAADLAGQPMEVMDNKFGVFGKGGTQRRRLSIALPGGGCEITWPQPPQKPFETAYAASYPGCGARMTWNLVEAITGLWTGDDWDSNNRGKRVVTVKTHYPHDAGRLVPWDDEINRALVIIRNPMHAIPSFFNHIYEMKNHLPVHSQRAPVDAWIEWRDRLAAIQISRFEKFVDYWMERFLQLNDNRIFISYERLTDDDMGPEEAVRMTRFLGQSEGVTPIDIESVPCVWKAVVKYKESLKSNKQQRRRLDPLHHDSQRSGPTERPYTPELLSSMSEMLLNLIRKWGDRHLRLLKILEGYQNDVAAAYLATTSDSDAAISSLRDVSAEQPQRKNFHVVLACPDEMDCTILSNILVGLFEPLDAYVSYMEDSSQLLVRQRGFIVPIESSVVTMTHDMNLLALYKTIKPKFDEVYFVAPINGVLCEYDNVLCVDNDALVYSNPDGMEDVVNKMANRLRHHFFEDPSVVSEWKLVVALNRLVEMESVRVDGKQASLLEEKFGIRSSGAGAGAGAMKEVAPFVTKDKAPLTINGKTYHIFQASPPHTASTVLNNVLIGMFEPDAEYSFMIYNKERTIRRHDKDVSIDDGHIVTKTHILDLMGLYKQHRTVFDEILFVVANRGISPETRIDASLCQYNNVLCVEYEELLYSDDQGREMVVRALAQKLKDRFDYFFGDELDLMDGNRLKNAVTRLAQMDQATMSLADQPFTFSDNKFGVHGGHRHRDGSEMRGSSAVESQHGKLFYCGGSLGLTRKEFKYSTFGLFLANSLFPEFEGKVEYQPGQPLFNTAIPLTDDTVNQATSNDILIMHSHQKCEIYSLEQFPGRQLHVNAEYYDMHPLHLLNPNGEFTLNYLPPGERSYIIGPHEDTRHSIRVPYCSMKLWYLHKTRPSESILPKIIDTSKKPKNTKENFLLYINSHYVEYRERAARALSDIGPIHTAGKCQGNFEVRPPTKLDGSPEQCEPFEEGLRPPSILPVSTSSGRDGQGQNSQLFSRYRFALVMENNADAPGYISEKILDAFLAGSIPIYFGSRFVFEIFNPKAFVFFDLAIPQQALNQIQFLEQNLAEYERMLNEPIIANEEVLEKYFSWDETVGNGSLKQRIRQMMGLQGSGASSSLGY
jgi:hypothetical protein